ncbi:MAG: DUF1048 domain-containing protein [Anaeroplasmataceae bacterium]
MSFIDKITGKDIDRIYKDSKDRLSKLPQKYIDAYKKIECKLWLHSNLSGRNVVNAINQIVSILEESYVDNVELDRVINNDIDKFCSDILGDTSKEYIKVRKEKLNRNIRRKVKEYTC